MTVEEGKQGAGPAAGGDPAELAKFSALADQWWDTNGPMRPLHMMNPVRLGFIREQVVRGLGLADDTLRPFEGLRILDVGCGGGILAEPLARLGAGVVGIDLEERLLAIARAHAVERGLPITYRAASTDDLVEDGQQFDVVIASEVVEHVSDAYAFLGSLAYLVRPGGMVIVTTLAKTSRSFALAIVGAEYVLRWLPRGTHDWRRFIKPSDLCRMLRTHGLVPLKVEGIGYDAVHQRFGPVQNVDVNYMVAAIRG